MEEVERFIVETIGLIVERSRNNSFRSEDQIHGYFEGRAKEALEPIGYEYLTETPTTVKYKRNAGGYLEPSDKGRPGRLDAVAKCDSALPVGIEMQYPRGKGRTEPDIFMSHICNDVLKLKNERLSGRYLLIFSYHNLPSGVTVDDVVAKARGVNLCYLRMHKKKDRAVDGHAWDAWCEPPGWVAIEPLRAHPPTDAD